MDEQRYQNACRLQEQGNVAEAYDEFIHVAENTADPLYKAGVMLQATHILTTLGQYDTAESKLSAVRALMKEHIPADANEASTALELLLDFEDANLCWLRGEDAEAVLKK